MDEVWLEGVECRVHLGVPAQERKRRQKVLIDVGLETDCSKPAADDDFRLAVDYWAVEKAVRAEAEARERRLCETLAEQLAALVLRTQVRARAVTIRVHKKPFVMPKTREVVVIVRRAR